MIPRGAIVVELTNRIMSVRVNIIAAIADNLALGNQGGLLWHISEDLKYFKRVTMGSPVIMGRKTFDSLGRALPGRLNVVITRNPKAVPANGVVVASSLEDALRAASGAVSSSEAVCVDFPPETCAGMDSKGVSVEGGSVEVVSKDGSCGDVFIIGGGEIYRQALPLADRLYITRVHTVPAEADTYFPPIDPEIWELVTSSEVQHDEASALDFEFVVYARKG